jgi:hypothetical protein
MMPLTDTQKQDVCELLCICWDIFVQPAILMGIFNNQLRDLLPDASRPSRMSYGAAVCLRIFISCFSNSRAQHALEYALRLGNDSHARILNELHGIQECLKQSERRGCLRQPERTILAYNDVASMV